MERDKNHPVSRNASEAESVFTERSGTLSTRNAPRTRKSRNVSTQILSSIRRVSQQSIESIKRVARNGDFITIVSLVTAGQGNGFFTIPWVWANGSLVPCLLLAFLTIFAYSFIGITVFEMSERHVGLIPSLGKDELPDISFIIDYKYGRKWGLLCVAFSALHVFGTILTSYINLSFSLYYFILGCFEISQESKYLESSENITTNLIKTTAFTTDSSFSNHWTLTGTVPLFLILIIFFMNVKSSVFFSRLVAAVGLPSTLIICCVLFWKASPWASQNDSKTQPYPIFSDALTCWPAAFYVSSFMPLLMSILKDVENRKHTRRDIVISQILSQSLNIIVGLTFLLTFPGDKSEISQNFVENFRDSKVATILCFGLMFLRFIGAYSMNFHAFRTFLSGAFFRKIFPGYGYSILLSMVVIGLSVVCAVFNNKPGSVLSLVGSITGLYFCSMVAVFDARKEDSFKKSPWYVLLRSGVLVVLSVIFIILQFIVTFSAID